MEEGGSSRVGVRASFSIKIDFNLSVFISSGCSL